MKVNDTLIPPQLRHLTSNSPTVCDKSNDGVAYCQHKNLHYERLNASHQSCSQGISSPFDCDNSGYVRNLFEKQNHLLMMAVRIHWTPRRRAQTAHQQAQQIEATAGLRWMERAGHARLADEQETKPRML
jgi:hypothetical protein